MESAWVWRMGGVTRDEAAKPFLRGQNIRNKRELSVQMTERRIGNQTRLMGSLLKVVTNIFSPLTGGCSEGLGAL